MAIRTVLKCFERADVSGVLFVPVDMPTLTPNLLRELGRRQGGAYYQGWPLPAFLPFKEISPKDKSIKGLLRTMRIPAREIPEGHYSCFINANTPDEWREAAG